MDHDSWQTTSGIGKLVGRRHQLDQFRRLLSDVSAGRGVTVLLHGEAGIGKTRLLEELVRSAESQGFESHWTTTWEGEGAPAFWPWIQIIRSLLNNPDRVATAVDLGPEGADIARLFPAAGIYLKEETAAPAGSEQARFRLFDAVNTFLARTASSRPLLLVFDDLQWADRASLMLLSFVGSQLRGVPILLAGSYRDEDPGFEANRPRFSWGTARIHLPGLTQEEARELVALHRSDVDDALLSKLHDLTSGNPLFISEFLHYAGPDILGAELPAGVRGIVEQRLRSLRPETRSLLADASVLGREFDVEEIAKLVGASANHVASLLSDARARGVVALRAPNSYVFSHSLIGTYLYGEAPHERRSELHLAAARLLEASGIGDHLAELAQHYSRAGKKWSPQAATYCEKAGAKAFAMLAYEDAAKYFDRALATADPLEPQVSMHLLLQLGEAQYLAGWSDESRSTFTRAAGIARSSGDTDSLAKAALGFGRRLQFAGIAGADAELIELLEEALRISRTDQNLTVELLCRLAYELTYSDRDRTRKLLGEALQLSETSADPSARLVVVERLHGWKVGEAPPSERLVLADEIIRVSSELGDSERELHGRISRVIDFVELGDFHAVRQEVEAFTKRVERTRLRTFLWYPALWNAMQALLGGRLDQAADLASAALEAGSSWGRIASDHFGLQTFALAWERGELEPLVAPMVAATESYPSVGAYRCALALAYLETGKESSARSELSQLSADRFSSLPSDFNRLISLALASEVCTRVGTPAEAETLYRLLAPHEDSFVWAGYATICFGSVHRFLGGLSWRAQRPFDAKRHFELALSKNAEAGAGPALARTRFDYASMLMERGSDGDRERAIALIEEASRAGREFGLNALVPRIASVRKPLEGANVLRREGAYWTVAFDGHVARLKDSKGLRDIARLIRSPGREFHVAELISSEGLSPSRTSEHLGSSQGGIPVIDEEARAQYRSRLEELQASLDEAEANNDLAAVANARAEMDFIAGHLASALGLGGRLRHAGDPAERARKAVGERIRNAIKRMESHHPALARHLGVSIRTGTFCSYSPEKSLTWEA